MAAEGQNKKRRNNNRNRNRNRNRNNRRRSGGSKGRSQSFSGVDKAVNSYLNLLEKHLQARKKYFELYHRADPRQLAKLERNFYNSMEELRTYEDKVKPEMLEEFRKKLDGRKPDSVYSENHQLEFEAPQVEQTGDFDDPHLLESQKSANFLEDTEESVGSLEDYQKYKGL